MVQSAEGASTQQPSQHANYTCVRGTAPLIITVCRKGKLFLFQTLCYLRLATYAVNTVATFTFIIHPILAAAFNLNR